MILNNKTELKLDKKIQSMIDLNLKRFLSQVDFTSELINTSRQDYVLTLEDESFFYTLTYLDQQFYIRISKDLGYQILTKLLGGNKEIHKTKNITTLEVNLIKNYLQDFLKNSIFIDFEITNYETTPKMIEYLIKDINFLILTDKGQTIELLFPKKTITYLHNLSLESFR